MNSRRDVRSLTPDVTTVAAQVAAGEGLGDRISVDDSTSSGVDQPSAFLHLGNELLVEQPLGLLVQRAVLFKD